MVSTPKISSTHNFLSYSAHTCTNKLTLMRISHCWWVKLTRNFCDLCTSGVAVGNPRDSVTGVLALTTFPRRRPLSELTSTVDGDLQLSAWLSALNSETSGSLGRTQKHFRGIFGDRTQLSDSSKSRQCLTAFITGCGDCSICWLGLSAMPDSSIDRPVLRNCLNTPAQGLFENRGFPKALVNNPTLGTSAAAVIDMALWEVRATAGEQKRTTLVWDTLLAWSGAISFVFGVALKHITTQRNKWYSLMTNTARQAHCDFQPACNTSAFTTQSPKVWSPEVSNTESKHAPLTRPRPQWFIRVSAGIIPRHQVVAA